jgi:hypothetical protein
MSGTVQIPDFRYSGLYYPQVYQDLLVFLRANVPEITDEDPHEPFIQLMRAFGLVGHYSGVMADHVAREALPPTARTREAVKANMSLIDYRLSQATPAVAEGLLKLTAALAAPTTIPAGTTFSTDSTDDHAMILFEITEAIALTASRLLTQAWEYVDATSTFVDRTMELNTDAVTFSPWGAAPLAGDMLYFGHDSVTWGAFVVKFSSAVTQGDVWGNHSHVVEFFDDHASACNPDSVTDLGGSIRVDARGFFGPHDRSGAAVRIKCRRTGIFEDVVSTWSGAVNQITTTSTLGQGAAPSTNPDDYLITAEWREFPYVGLDTADLPTAFVYRWGYSIPFNPTEDTSTTPRYVSHMRWQRCEVNGIDAYWARLRIVRNTAVTPVFDRYRINDADQYVPVDLTQGQTGSDEPAGSSTGMPSQTFTTTQEDIIEGTVEVYVDEGSGWVAWVHVLDFLSSASTSRHYTLDYDSTGRAVVTFGNGTAGKVPALGTGNIRIDFRYGATDDGNVGAGEIAINKSGLGIVSTITNPEPASGYAPAAGSTPEDLERVKVAGPASLRALNRALTVADCEFLATDPTEGFKTASGASPVARAVGIEEYLGPKTIGLIVVGLGGDALPAATIAELEEYFNGDPLAGVDGVLLLNSELTAVNYTAHPINVTATVKGSSVGKVTAAIKAYLDPLAVDERGEYEHDLGGTVRWTKIIDVIYGADPGVVKNVVLTAPAADVVLAADELPTWGVLAIVVT